MVNFVDLAPDQFLIWWFKNAEAHGLSADYHLLYPNYFDRPDAIPYVWRHFRYRMRHLMDVDLKGKAFLDVGCGIGTEVMWAAIQGADALGIDMHQLSFEIATKRLDILTRTEKIRCQIKKQNLLDLHGKFDVIFLRETFHHLEPRSQIVAKLAALLAPGGKIIIEETNGYNPVVQLKYFLVRGRNTVVTKRPSDGMAYLFGNERITTPNNLSKLFAPHDVTGNAEYFRILPTALARVQSIAKVAEFAEKLMRKSKIFAPVYLHYSWVGRKCPAAIGTATGPSIYK